MTVERKTSLVIGRFEVKFPWAKALSQDKPQKLATLKPIDMDVVITRTLTPTSVGADVWYLPPNGSEKYNAVLEQYQGKGLDEAVVHSEKNFGPFRLRRTYKWQENGRENS